MRLSPAIALSLVLFLPLAWALAAEDTGLQPVLIDLDDSRIGGLSGLVVSAAGRQFTAVSDAGYLVEGELKRDSSGRLTGAAVTGSRRLDVPPDAENRVDAEGLSPLPDGGLAVSMEGGSGIWVLRGAEMSPLPAPPDMGLLAASSMYEALATDAQGRLLTLPESPVDGGPAHPLWRLDEKGWRRLGVIERSGGYLPVGADVGPDGWLYLLERSIRLGFRHRIRRLDPDQPTTRPETLWSTVSHRRSNFEGLSVWSDPEGHLRATLVSDNNFTAAFRQELLEIPLDLKGPSR
ncbi:MAG: esterase-like activity of phytase family protein [Rhodobacteraceae bacterium]|nr:esterase-like activity of phytase family protein [Paracoccaceae bacterium]MBR9821077.1 esterase-like activity of phytase family protein [Paracoccaceae bacterium]